MAEILFGFIVDLAPAFSGTLISILLAVWIINNSSEILSFFKKFLNVRRWYYSNRRAKYNKTLCSKEFIAWQMQVLEKIYRPLIDRKRDQGWDINLTELKIGNTQQKYEAVTLQLPTVGFPFHGICDKNLLETTDDITVAKYTHILKKFPKLVRKYYRLIEGTIRHPKRLGYMLEEINHGEKDGRWALSAHCGTYENNIKTSHILEYELYKVYKKNPKIVNLDRDQILKSLPVRNLLHKKFSEMGDESDILVSGQFRESLLSVQMFVMVKNFSGKYDTLRIRRSSNVSSKANYLQFIPSGGFEAVNDCDGFDAQWDNYSVGKVVFRELLEECFGIDEDDKCIADNNVSADKIYHNEHIRKLIAMLNGNNGEGNVAHMDLLGTTMSLVGLRQELCFVLKVDDMNFSTEFTSNYESKSAIHLVSIENLEKEGFWRRRYFRGDLRKEDNDLIMLNCTSAGLFELARKSDLYQEALQTKAIDSIE